ncbi:hypothetical protein [Streptomyces afghaniensis]|uniref:hypothetical protein n=1 Tax=Streptomyces afghaniensis TaxID=66865 RepID=UPI003792A827
MVESTSQGGAYGGPEDAVFVPGVDYVSAWRDADAAAQELNAAVEALGLDARVVRAIPHAAVNGEPVVWIRPEAVRLLADRLVSMASREAG